MPHRSTVLDRRPRLEPAARRSVQDALPLRAAIDAAVDGVILMDTQGQVTLFNPACERMFGYSAAEVIGGNVGKLMPVDATADHDRSLSRHVETGENHIIGTGREVVGRRSDGECFPLDLSVSRAEADGQVFYVGVLRDVSHRKRSEALRDEAMEQLACQARVIEEQRCELETFAYALAHDFKQPIRQITTFSQMLAEEIAPDAGSDAQLHLSFLGAAAGRLGRLVDVMTQYTLLNRPPALSAVALEDVAAEVRISLAPLLKDCGGALVSRLGGARVRGNLTLLVQVLQNLTVNGLRYNRSSDPRVVLEAERDGADWVLSVTDNGIGIAPEYASEIFKPLVRLHRESEYPGTGLGLTLARKAVQALNGGIWCGPAPGGQGSIFSVRLPAAGRRASR